MRLALGAALAMLLGCTQVAPDPGDANSGVLFGYRIGDEYPATVVSCLSGVSAAGDDALWMTDQCIGMVMKLVRQ